MIMNVSGKKIACSRFMKRLLTSDDKRKQQQMKSLQSDHCQISDDVSVVSISDF